MYLISRGPKSRTSGRLTSSQMAGFFCRGLLTAHGTFCRCGRSARAQEVELALRLLADSCLFLVDCQLQLATAHTRCRPRRFVGHMLNFSQIRSLGGSDMMKRRAFLGGTLSAVTVASAKAQSATAIAPNSAIQTPPGPLVWPVVTKPQPGIRLFAGHTDTVPDIVGRIGTPPGLSLIHISEPTRPY